MYFRSLFRWIFLFASLKFEFLTESPKETNCQNSGFALACYGNCNYFENEEHSGEIGNKNLFLVT